MARYPKAERSDALLAERASVTEEERALAREFGRDYFDGSRRHGLGGYRYDPKYWTLVVKDMAFYYGLNKRSSVLDVGCGKGFTLYDFKMLFPGMTVAGIDISDYCLHRPMVGMEPHMRKASCDAIPCADKSYDFVVSIATIHNLDIGGVRRSLREIMRVSKGHAFIKVNGYRNEEECDLLLKWNLVAKTILHVDEWRALFKQEGYTGDYSFFVP
jgi:SAM-dependent methyltransferase